MAGFTIPNTPDAYNQNQAEPDSLDFQILGDQRYGVISGMVVTPEVGGTVAVAAGVVLVNGQQHSFAGVQGVVLTPYVSAPFFDLIVARYDGSSNVTVAVLAGTTVNPRYPSINGDTDVVLATVWRDTSGLTVNHITDKRYFVRGNSNYVEPGDPDPARGVTGDIWIKSNWTAGASLDSPLSVKVGAAYVNLARWSGTENIITTGSFTGANLTLSGNATANRVIPASNAGTGSPVRVWGVTSDSDNTLRAYPTTSLSVATSVNSTTATQLVSGTRTLTAWSNTQNSSAWRSTSSLYVDNVGNVDRTFRVAFSFASDFNSGIGNPAQGYVSIMSDRNTAAVFYKDSITFSSTPTVFSSIRFKTNVKTFEFNPKDLLGLRLVTYQKVNSSDKVFMGVIAEELEQLGLGNTFVTYDEEGRPNAVDYVNLSLSYIELLKDHEARLTKLEAKKK